jgi:hypothetical protein
VRMTERKFAESRSEMVTARMPQSDGGRFPRERIYDVIDGGNRLAGHYNFDSPMPLWGLSFPLKGTPYTSESEASVWNCINLLLDYLESIQQK